METQIKAINSYIQHNHLYLNINRNEAIFLGYNLNTTKTEYAILRALMENTKFPISAEQISTLSSLEMSKENIRFHISNINKKAKITENRTLIKNIAKNGYFLNEEM